MVMSGYSQLPMEPCEWWPVQQPGEYADYSYCATGDITVNGVQDNILSMSIAVMPSGSGEVQLSRLTLSDTGNLITVWLQGGVAGRVYIYQLILNTQALRTYQIFIGQLCNPLLAANPVPPPPSPFFGNPVTWP